MAKDNEKKLAYTYYVDECLTAKEIALKLGVSEKTVGNWVEKGNWREIRLSKQTTPATLVSKYTELLNILLDKRLEAERGEGNASVRPIIDEMSKVSAMIDRIQTENKATLRIHIHCLEKFMAALHTTNPKLYMQLIDFQKEYLTLLAEELK